MALLLLLLFPVLEIYVFIQAIDEYGFWAVLAEVLLTAWIGVTVLKFRSLIVMGAIHKTVNRQAKPEDEMIKSLLIFLGAILLIVPGIITDVIGLLCLFAPTRKFIGMIMRRRLGAMMSNGRFQMVFNGQRGPFGGPGPGGVTPDFQKGDIRDVSPNTDDSKSGELIYLHDPNNNKKDV